MSLFSIVVVLVCACGAALVTFILLVRRFSKLEHRQTTGSLPPPEPTKRARETTPTGGEAARGSGGQTVEEIKSGSFSETGSEIGKTPPGAGPELTRECPSGVISVVEPSSSSSCESSPETQGKEIAVPLNEEAAKEGEKEMEGRPPTQEALSQGSTTPVGGTTGEKIEREGSSANLIEPQQQKMPKSKAKKKREKHLSSMSHAKHEGDAQPADTEPEIYQKEELFQNLVDAMARIEISRPAPYRPPSQEPLAVPRRSAAERKTGRIRPITMALSVCLQFVRSGYCKIGLLPERTPEMPEEIVLASRDNDFNVAAIQDEWYEAVFPENLGEILENGVKWKGIADSGLVGYWQLSGRDLYVLSGKALSAFVQTTRLKIGRKHVLLCRDGLQPKVEEILRETGCRDLKRVPESSGTPRGWVAIRDVVPTAVVKIEAVPDIFSILQPEPELEIDLEGGVYLKQSTWLGGFPPRICVSGALNSEVEVFVDGERARSRGDDSFETPAHDAIGEHIISVPVGNLSKTYRICEISEDWEPWNAHNFGRVQLCGPLLLASNAGQSTCAIVVPSRNPVLLGSHPGEIAWCPRISGPKRVGFAAFDSVWALPDNPFGADKLCTRVLMLKPLPLVPEPRYQQFAGKKAVRVSAWCAAILNASRKGLCIEPEGEDAASLWKEYKRHARALRKKMKG
jgi:hypothetical protein